MTNRYSLISIFFFALFITILQCFGQVDQSGPIDNLEKKIEFLQKNCNLNPDSVLVEIKKLLENTDTLLFCNEHAELVRLKGLANFYKGQYNTALDLFNKSRNLFKKTGNIDGEADAMNNVAIIYGQLGYHATNLEMDLEILEMRKKSGNILKLAMGYNNLAVSYQRNMELEKALENYLKTIDIYIETGHTLSLDLTYNNIGYIHQIENRPDSAFYYFNKSLEYSIPLNHKQMMSNSYVYIGDYYWNKDQIKEAEKNYVKGLDLALQTGIVYEIEWAAKALQKAQAQLGDYKNAYKSLQLQKQMADSAKSIEIIQRITQIESELEFEKEREFNRISAEKAQLENLLEINKQKQARNVAIILFFSLFVTAVFIYRNYLLKKSDNALLKKQKAEISAQKDEILQQRNKIDQMNKTKDKFFAIIAHDLKNPLGGMLNLSETIYNNFSFIGPDKMITYLGSIKDSSKKVYTLLENLLQWAALQIGNIIPKPTEFDLCRLIKENIELLSLLAAQKNIELKFEGEPNCKAFADQSMINTVIRNLLTNAVKFTPPNGRITVRITKEKLHHKVYVSDNGNGISPEQMSSLFELKTEKDARPKSKDIGVGLGLILCKEFTTLNDGQIGVESQPEQGSTFWFTVPCINFTNDC
jgi:signal transduction histidine kinase